MFKNFPFGFGLKFLFLLTALLISSCHRSEEPESEIRIVDLNGRAKPVKRFVPEGNVQALASIRSEANRNNSLAPNATQQIQKPSVDIANAASLPPVIPTVTEAPISQAPVNNTNLEQIPAIATTPTAMITTNTTVSENKTTETKPETEILYDLSSDLSKPSNIETVKVTENQTSQPSTKKFKISAISTAKPTTDLTVKAINTKKSSRQSGIFVQIGAFSESSTANNILQKNYKISSGTIEAITLGDKKNYRVLLGPITNKIKAGNILKQVKNAGYKDAFIVK